MERCELSFRFLKSLSIADGARSLRCGDKKIVPCVCKDKFEMAMPCHRQGEKMGTAKKQAKKSFAILLLILVLSLSYNSYGDTIAPKPNPTTWSDVPATTGPHTITMRATIALDVNDSPVNYNFICTNDGNFSSGWITSPTYEAAGLTASTAYSFKVYARDNVGNTDTCSIILSTTTDADTTPPRAKTGHELRHKQ